jgi:putative ABC transport system permease protein
VVGDIRHFGLGAELRPEFYLSYMKEPWPYMSLVIRTESDPLLFAPVLRQQIRAIDRDLPLAEMWTLDQLLDSSLRQPRFQLVLMSAFASLALMSATIGLYGTTAYTVGLRTHEIGIRISLGAVQWRVISMILSQVLRITLTGLALGLGASMILTRYLASLLFGVSPNDPTILASVACALLCVALIAGYLPAHRASRIEPMNALCGRGRG